MSEQPPRHQEQDDVERGFALTHDALVKELGMSDDEPTGVAAAVLNSFVKTYAEKKEKPEDVSTN